MSIKTLSVLCPTCKQEVLLTPDFPERPFCSKRCKTLDFGDWANENHRIPTATPPEESEDTDSWSQDA